MHTHLPEKHEGSGQEDAALRDGTHKRPRLVLQPPPQLRSWRHCMQAKTGVGNQTAGSGDDEHAVFSKMSALKHPSVAPLKGPACPGNAIHATAPLILPGKVSFCSSNAD